MRRTRLFRTTALRLSLLYAVLFGLLTAGALGFMYWTTGRYVDAQIATGLHTEFHELRRVYQDRGAAGLDEVIDRRGSGVAHTGRYYAWQNRRGQMLAGNLRRWPAAVTLDGEVHNLWLDNQVRFEPSARRVDEAYIPVIANTLPDGSELLIAQGVHDAEDMREHIFGVVLLTISVTMLLALALGVLMGRSVLRRIDTVTHAAGDIMAGDLSRRIPLGRRSDEFDELALRLNAMLDRIEQLMSALREVTSNIAHDLRSPLTRLRNRLDVTLLEPRASSEYREAMEQAIADADDLLKTFNALLSIAQVESGVHGSDWQALDLSALAADLAELYQAVAEEQGLGFDNTIQPGVSVRGNRHLLAQALGNLLENAIKYTPTGGHVRLALQREGTAAVLVVSDSGPGIPEAQRARVLERFVRLDSQRSTPGNGLGLSLVKAVAQLHGAALELGDNRPGLRIALRFPPLEGAVDKTGG